MMRRILVVDDEESMRHMLQVLLKEEGYECDVALDGRQAMDSDPTVRDLPLLTGVLELYASAAKASDSKPLVQIYADGDASQQRVIDVLNALAGVKISSVTFTDLVD